MFPGSFIRSLALWTFSKKELFSLLINASIMLDGSEKFIAAKPFSLLLEFFDNKLFFLFLKFVILMVHSI